MSKKDKLISRLKSKPRDFTFDEVVTLLLSLGFIQLKTGQSGGSVIKFALGSKIVKIHKPHAIKTLHKYQVKDILNDLERWNMI